jgi:ribosomal protein S21
MQALVRDNDFDQALKAIERKLAGDAAHGRPSRESTKG